MQIVVLSNESLKSELLTQVTDDLKDVVWVKEPEELLDFRDAGIYIDLLFTDQPQRIGLLQRLTTGTVLVNAMYTTLENLPAGFIRFNGWNTFLKRPVIEAAGSNEKLVKTAADVFAVFNKTLEPTPDVPGFLSARVVSMIINEAYFALQDEVSTKDEIDTAMKLGTNYPYGPFEWSRLIGIKNVHSLLEKLSAGQAGNSRYAPAALLTEEANA